MRYLFLLATAAACTPPPDIIDEDTYPCSGVAFYVGGDGFVEGIDFKQDFYCSEGAGPGQDWVDDAINVCLDDVRNNDQYFLCTFSCGDLSDFCL